MEGGEIGVGVNGEVSGDPEAVDSGRELTDSFWAPCREGPVVPSTDEEAEVKGDRSLLLSALCTQSWSPSPAPSHCGTCCGRLLRCRKQASAQLEEVGRCLGRWQGKRRPGHAGFRGHSKTSGLYTFIFLHHTLLKYNLHTIKCIDFPSRVVQVCKYFSHMRSRLHLCWYFYPLRTQMLIAYELWVPDERSLSGLRWLVMICFLQESRKEEFVLWNKGILLRKDNYLESQC